MGAQPLGGCPLTDRSWDAAAEVKAQRDPRGLWTRNREGVSIEGRTLAEAAMEPDVPTPDQALLEALRHKRADLRDSMSALEHALAAPAPGRPGAWAERVHVALVELSADFREHVDITESPSGLYQRLRMTAPRLSNAVARLTSEHTQIADLVDDLLGRVNGPDGQDVDPVRDLGMALLGRLARHRQHGSDLVYEAYAVDIGGET
jgi:hypothetical protein